MPTLARSMLRSTPGARMFCPLNRMSPTARWPGYSEYMRFIVRSSVDLPQPDGPMNAVTRRSAMSRLMSFSPWNLP